MNIKEIILKEITEQGSINVRDIIRLTGFSRTYINRFLNNLEEENRILLIGKANKARYILTEDKYNKAFDSELKNLHLILKNNSLEEYLVLKEVKRKSLIYHGLKQNVSNILDYAFTEMLNNAIEHSKSDKIDILITRESGQIHFTITDKGIGIYNNIMQKMNLANQMEAIQNIMKGKQTTMPEYHSGEGIFFTSKIADLFNIKSQNKKIVFDNMNQDIYIQNIKNMLGTQVNFRLKEDSNKFLKNVFDQFSDESSGFTKTEINVKLYQSGVDYLSRSQARRIIAGLEEFKTITLDFDKVETIGQAFADEIFRVWQNNHPNIEIVYKNAHENIEFMIKRAKT